MPETEQLLSARSLFPKIHLWIQQIAIETFANELNQLLNNKLTTTFSTFVCDRRTLVYWQLCIDSRLKTLNRSFNFDQYCLAKSICGSISNSRSRILFCLFPRLVRMWLFQPRVHCRASEPVRDMRLSWHSPSCTSCQNESHLPTANTENLRTLHLKSIALWAARQATTYWQK
jgi:hypothetical protein